MRSLAAALAAMPVLSWGGVAQAATGEPVVTAAAGRNVGGGSRQELVNMGRNALGPLSVMINAAAPRVRTAAEKAQKLSLVLGADLEKEWKDAPGFKERLRGFKEFFDSPNAGIKVVLNQAANRAPKAVECVKKLSDDPDLPRSRKQLGCLLSSRLVLTAYRKVMLEKGPRARELLKGLEAQPGEAGAAGKRYRALYKEMMIEFRLPEPAKVPYDILPPDQKAMLAGLAPSAERIQKEVQEALKGKERARKEMQMVADKTKTLAKTTSDEPRKLHIHQGVAVNVVVHQSLNVALALP